MASSIPKEFKKEIVDVYVAETTWKVALFISTSNCMTQSLYSSCTNEVSDVGTGYALGGITLAGRADSYVSENVMLDATDGAVPAATFVARFALVYNPATSKIRARYDFGVDKTVSTGTFTIQWSVNGLFRLS
jgi:hypothetical protein